MIFNLKTTPARYRFSAMFIAIALGAVFAPRAAKAVTTVFFDGSQTTNVTSGTTSDTMTSEGYIFTYTRDKLFTGGIGLTNPIGRAVRVPWPSGLEAQAVTAGMNQSGARIDIKRQDGQPFAIPSFSFKLLANTGGAGASLEIMPMVNGEDGLPNPLAYNATGYYGQTFSYTSPQLTNYTAYKITLYVDYALMNFIAIDASIPPPTLDIAQLDAATIQLAWPANATAYWLESTTDLTNPNWSAVTNSPVPSGDVFTVDLPMTGSGQWFRLHK